MGTKLITDETAEAILADYKAGKRIRDIEQEHDVSRSSIYWVLKRENVAPQRTKSASRLSGDTHDLVQLYVVIEAQEARIAELEGLLEANGVAVPYS